MVFLKLFCFNSYLASLCSNQNSIKFEIYLNEFLG